LYESGRPTRKRVSNVSELSDLRDKLGRLQDLPADVLDEVTDLAERIALHDKREKAQKRFIPFVKAMWPGFIEGAHHRIMAEAFERVAAGKLKRLIINMPPRHTKSEFASHMLPAWFLGMYPNKKIIQSSHTAELSKGFGRKVRDLVSSTEFQEIFPGVALKKDSTAAARWETNSKGEYFAVGVGGAVAGKGADLYIIDDSVSEQEGMSNDPAKFEDVYNWYESGPRQRLQPQGAIIIVETRWNKMDLTGRVLKKAAARKGVDEWEVIEFPALLDDTPGKERALWPGFWSVEEMMAIKNEITPFRWNAQYMQDPTSTLASIVKRDWWKIWKEDKPPDCTYIIQSWDTAFTKNTRSDYSACTTWGVFYTNKGGAGSKSIANLILLDAYKGRLEFPELKEMAHKKYVQYEPDTLVIETRAAGWPLIHELRERGLFVTDYTPSRGEDKYVRINAVADMFASGIVWAPETNFAEEVKDEFADFPGEHDDLLDSTTQALIKFRQGGLIKLETDYHANDDDFQQIDASGYY
jgi:predicted phage terminase large subunit-like protein